MFKLVVILLALAHSITLAHGLTLGIGDPTCPDDPTPPKCETSDGSPLVSDCQAALLQLSGASCENNNGGGSHCTTVARVGTCKVDACGATRKLRAGINCGGYLQSILNSCQSNDKVGGQLTPADCNVLGGNGDFRVQFSRG